MSGTDTAKQSRVQLTVVAVPEIVSTQLAGDIRIVANAWAIGIAAAFRRVPDAGRNRIDLKDWDDQSRTRDRIAGEFGRSG
jgi:hypothetical protein